jgi:hypothetical protein
VDEPPVPALEPFDVFFSPVLPEPLAEPFAEPFTAAWLSELSLAVVLPLAEPLDPLRGSDLESVR